MADTASRLGGSGRSILFFGGPDGHIPIVYCRTLREDAPRLVRDHVFIQPIDWPVPSEVMTAQAMGGGTVEVELIEGWSEQAWNRLGGALTGLGGAARGGSNNACDTILDIVRAISRTPGSIYLSKIIATPQYSSEQLGGSGPQRRATFYMNAKIVEAQGGDQEINIETMQVTKRVRFAYTHRLFQISAARDPQTSPEGLPTALPSGASGDITLGPQLQGVL